MTQRAVLNGVAAVYYGMKSFTSKNNGGRKRVMASGNFTYSAGPAKQTAGRPA